MKPMSSNNGVKIESITFLKDDKTFSENLK